MSALPPLPVTVISGFLGAGKTSLVNHLLREAGGRKIMVMVNDFGALNIDAELIESADGDKLTLSNGCVCCTMGAELLYALAGALDRRPRPDWLVIEASGVADPAKIAEAAHAEPEMVYQGIVAMADAASFAERIHDPMIGDQVAQQIRVADLVLVTRTDLAAFETAREVIATLSDAPVAEAPFGKAPIGLLADRPQTAAPDSGQEGHDHDHGHDQDHGHGHHHDEDYRSWSASGGRVSADGLKALLADPPPGLYRFKGLIVTDLGAMEAQLVGRSATYRRSDAQETHAVAIGPSPLFEPEEFERRWAEIAV